MCVYMCMYMCVCMLIPEIDYQCLLRSFSTFCYYYYDDDDYIYYYYTKSLTNSRIHQFG